MSDLVIDCSIAMSWLFEDESDPYAEAVLTQISGKTALVPSIFHIEVFNVLIKGERRKRTTTEKADAFLLELESLRIEVEPAPLPSIRAAILLLARVHQLSAYDAMYLELALRQRLPLATLDEPLLAAALRENVLPFDPSP